MAVIIPAGTTPGWVPVVDTTIAGAAVTSVTLSGLNGDVDELYKIFIKIVHAGVEAAVDMQPNADVTANNYFYGILQASGASITGQQSTSNSAGMRVAYSSAGAGTTISELFFNAKTGTVRTLIGSEHIVYSGGNTSILQSIASGWKDTAANITSLKFVGGTGAFGVGSRFLIQKRSL